MKITVDPEPSVNLLGQWEFNGDSTDLIAGNTALARSGAQFGPSAAVLDGVNDFVEITSLGAWVRHKPEVIMAMQTGCRIS
ncbi:hypothetical protein J7412_18710 [Shimia sp. R9_3]|nr:hypothetical protein [Shimia sp. R9_3]